MKKIYHSFISPMKEIEKNQFKSIACLTLVCCLLLSFITVRSQPPLTQSGFTSVLTPKFMAGTDNARLPVMYRATVSGLTANTTYRFYTQAALSSDFGGTDGGSGNPLLVNSSGTTYYYTASPSLTAATRYQTFTTNENGSYTGWFGFVNSQNPKFSEGNDVYPTIVIGNNSNGAVVARKALNESIKVLKFASAAGAGKGSFLKENTSGATAKNIVVLYENIEGTGRPLFVGPVNPIGVSIADVISGYTTSAGGWNAIIPNDNPNGVKRIEQRAVSNASIIGCAVDADGVWPSGAINTVSPTSGLTPLVISNTDAPLNICCGNISVSVVAAGTINCNGDSTTVTVSATGGTAPFVGIGTFTVKAGTHNYLVTDANGCTGTASITIGEPSALVASAEVPALSCGSDSVAVTINATGGVAPYSGTGIFIAAAGEHTYLVTDANGCTDTVSFTVSAIADSIAPLITAPASLNISTNDGCVSSGVNLGTPVTSDNCSVANVTNDAPKSFPIGTTIVTWTITDAGGNIATAVQSVTVSDNQKPAIYLQGSRLLQGITGPGSTQTPYLLPSKPGIKFTSIISVNDQAGSYRMAGIADGLGAFDNGDGTFTLLMNHEIPNTLGISRAHGAKGSFVSKWIIDKTTLATISGYDLMQQVYFWDTLTKTFSLSTVALSRFCSADLPPLSAFYNSSTGLGTTERIFMNGEESGVEGKGFAHIVTGSNAGKSYELPYLGKFAWENSLASPAPGDKTIVAGTDDGTGGQVYFYIGTKTNTGIEIEKAGLQNGKLFGVKVQGMSVETNGGVPAPGTRFEMVDFGNVQNKTGLALNNESITAGVTTFLRPEDGAWNPSNNNEFYFVTTNSFNAPSRLWRLRFDSISSPEAGGTVEAVLTGTEGIQMLDNMSVDKLGQIIIQEDVGNNAHIGKIWQYSIANDSLKNIAYHDTTRFRIGGASFLTQDEESSGVIDMSEILGPGMYLLDVQAHFAPALNTTEVVEGGQLLAMYNPYAFGVSTATDTVNVTITSGTSASVNLGVPATADNCSVASVSNDAPGVFPLGTTIVNWTVTDGSGNTNTAAQVVIVKINSAPDVSIILPTADTMITTGKDINLEVTASDGDGIVSKVDFYENGRKFHTDSTAPYQYSANNLVPAGVYNVTAVAFDNLGDSTISDTLIVTIEDCEGSGSISGYGFTGIPGTFLNNLGSDPDYPLNPDIIASLGKFEYAGVGDNYGARVRGYICAPATGFYIFYIASDDQSELYLSTDDNPANVVKIAYVNGAVGPRSWYSSSTQKSVAIRLVKGTRYYIESVHKASGGNDHLAVGWILPGGSFEAPIPGSRLSPWESVLPSTSSARANGGNNQRSFTEAMQSVSQGLNVKVRPNPSTGYFELLPTSSSAEKLQINVTDMLGRRIEQRTEMVNKTIRLGSNLKAGVYFVEVKQGKESKRIKLVKQ
jgi:hypothetical protein